MEYGHVVLRSGPLEWSAAKMRGAQSTVPETIQGGKFLSQDFSEGIEAILLIFLRIGAFVTGRKKRRKMVLFNPHLTFDPEDYIGYAIRFWKEELPNILKTYQTSYVVFRLRHCSGVKKCFVL